MRVERTTSQIGALLLDYSAHNYSDDDLTTKGEQQQDGRTEIALFRSCCATIRYKCIDTFNI